MGEAHQNQTKQLNQEEKKYALATRKMNRKRTPPTQISTQTQMDLWNSAMEDSLQFEHRNPPALSIQDSPIHSERSLVHKEPQDL
jgi:hypothetical protein